MACQKSAPHEGFTVIEVLVVITVISLLVALTIPAIQSARESARRAQCLDNMRQFGIAFANFESQNGALPAGITMEVTGPLSGNSELHVYDFMSDLLPFLDASAIDAQYHRDSLFCAPQNATAIATPLSVALCPSAPRTDVISEGLFVPSSAISTIVSGGQFASMMSKLDSKYSTTFQAAISDYSVPAGASAELANQFGYTVPMTALAGLEGVFPWPIGSTNSLVASATRLMSTSGTVTLRRTSRIAEVADGTSNTFILTEVAGRPDRWQNGVNTGIGAPLQSAWADPRIVLQIDGTREPSGTCVLQCDNDDEIYSFHSGGVNVLFIDGHVQTASANLDARVLLAWLTPGKGDAP